MVHSLLSSQHGCYRDACLDFKDSKAQLSLTLYYTALIMMRQLLVTANWKIIAIGKLSFIKNFLLWLIFLLQLTK